MVNVTLLRRLWIGTTTPVDDVAGLFGVSRGELYRIMADNLIAQRKRGPDPVTPVPEVAFIAAYKSGHTFTQMAADFGLSRSAAVRRVRRLKLARGQSDG